MKKAKERHRNNIGKASESTKKAQEKDPPITHPQEKQRRNQRRASSGQKKNTGHVSGNLRENIGNAR